MASHTEAGPATPRTARAAPRTDVHQHLWPEGLITALARRTTAPRLEPDGAAWRLLAAGEPPCAVDPADHNPDARADLARRDGVDRILVAPSCPIGIEVLPPDESAGLVEAYHEGVRALGGPFGAWAAAPLVEPDPAALTARLAEGFAGLCLPAGALSSPGAAEHVAPLLAALEDAGAPLFVHPGPGPRSPAPVVPRGAPGWWAAMTSYVAQMQTAWLVWHGWTAEWFPRLRVCFPMLAGLAPLQGGRLAARGGTPGTPDGRTFLDTSSYDPRAVDAVAAVTGRDALVHGTDRPVPVTEAPPAADALLRTNPARLLGTETR